MVSYNDNSKSGELHITINMAITYTFDFLNMVTEISKKIVSSNSETVFISAKTDEFQFDRLGLAYFYNLLMMLTRYDKKIYVVTWLMKLFVDNVDTNKNKFENIDILETLNRDKLLYFEFRKDNDVSEAVQKIAEFIGIYCVVSLGNFLITTIGEIFSNAFNHSEEQKVYLMYDIRQKEEDYYLWINIMDFGKTIVSNVKEYVEEKYHTKYTSNECIEWAIQNGNTTRNGSGGYGLPTLINYIKAVKGELLIFSGDSIYALVENKEDIMTAKGSFYGTNIFFKIPLFDTSTFVSFDEKTNTLISIDLDDL